MDQNRFDRIARTVGDLLRAPRSRRLALAAAAGLGAESALAGRGGKRQRRCRGGRVRYAGKCLLPCVEGSQCPDDPFTTWCWPTVAGTQRFCGDLGAELSDVCDLAYRNCSTQSDCRAGQVCLSTACLPRCMDVV